MQDFIATNILRQKYIIVIYSIAVKNKFMHRQVSTKCYFVFPGRITSLL